MRLQLREHGHSGLCQSPHKEPNVLELDEYAEELHNEFDSISGVRLDPELLSVSRKVEIDLMNRLEVYRKRPRSWAKDKGIHVIPTQWADVNKGDDKRPEYRSRLRGKELERWDPTMPGTFASIGPFECVMFFTFKSADVENPGQVVRRLGRSCSCVLRGHTVKLKRPMRWRLSCFLKNRWRAKTWSENS